MTLRTKRLFSTLIGVGLIFCYLWFVGAFGPSPLTREVFSLACIIFGVALASWSLFCWWKIQRLAHR